MQKTYTDYINAALDILDQSLQVYVEARLKVCYGARWQEYLPQNVRIVDGTVHWDTQAILNTMIRQWHDVFQAELGFAGRNLVGELKEWRNEIAHRAVQKPLTSDDAFRAVDTVWRLLSLIPLPQAQAVRSIRDELQSQYHSKPVPQEPKPVPAQTGYSTSDTIPTVTYSYHRLGFKAGQIEPLQPDQAFRVVTPVGTFQMTKAEFYSNFPKVIQSRSYAENGLYHYPTVPQKALPFKLHD